jgi:DNA topoisomerase I
MAVPNPLGRIMSFLINSKTTTSHASYPAYSLSTLFYHRRSLSSSTPFLSSATTSNSSSNTTNSTAPAVLLVESPAKAKKIQEYLGPEYRVIASYGHIRDLPAKTGSVNPEEGFEMRWELADGARARVTDIAKAVKEAPRVYLATDPDREGEAISWHLVEELKNRGAILSKTKNGDVGGGNGDGSLVVVPQRITFTEVTKSAIEAALAAPREVSIPLVEAYMARRALDYLFGFNLSPLLWRKLPGARSAGRVQSVALRLIADREAAIEAFTPQQYWTLHAQVDVTHSDSDSKKAMPVLANLTSVDGHAPPSPGFLDVSIAENIRTRIDQSQFSVAAVSKKETTRNPPPPFTTSTLQQEANKRLGWGAARTMQYAQKLYEAGIITYMRTDGVSISPQAIEKIQSAILQLHGQSFLPEKPRFYSSKSKNAQEAHEAIRPTNFSRPPSTLVPQGIEAPALQLYSLIWSRALASQMASVRIQNVGADFVNEDKSLKLRSTASHTLFPGYLAAYGFGGGSGGGGSGSGSNSGRAAAASAAFDNDDEASTDSLNTNSITKSSSTQFLSGEQAASALSQLLENSPVFVHDPEAAGHETRPPGRFTEGTLVKALEEAGVGRPSTYAPTLKLLQARKYVRKEGRALHPEPLGRVLSSFLCLYFPTYVDPAFTSRMEEELDLVSAGKESWKELLGEFWGPFHQRVGELANLTGTEVIDALNEELEILLFGKKGEEREEGKNNDDNLLQSGANDGEASLNTNSLSSASSSSAASDNSLETSENQEVTSQVDVISPPGKACPSCGKPLSLKLSHRGGPFIGCTAYPECKYTRQAGIDLFGDTLNGSGTSESSTNGNDNATTNSAADGSSDGNLKNLNSQEVAEQYGLRGPARFIGKDSRDKPIFLRQGPYGPYAQLGTDTDHEMRRAPLPKSLNLRTVKLDYALSLLALPRTLGNHPETNEPVIIRNGKFGPYVSHKRSMRSLSKDLDPLSITFEEALELLKVAEVMAEKKEARKKLKEEAVNSKGNGEEVSVKRGRKVGSGSSVKKVKVKSEKKKIKEEKESIRADGDADGVTASAKKISRKTSKVNKNEAISEPDDNTVEPVVMRARSAFQFFLQGN